MTHSPSLSKRRSALKARQSLTATLQPLSRICVSSATTPAAVERAIGNMTRRRKARHARLKELAKEEATWLARCSAEGEAVGIVCPVCSQTIRGDRDVVEAHIDACLAYESRRAQLERERERTVRLMRENEDADVDVDVDTGWGAVGEESARTRVITNASLRGTGIHIRPSTVDTEDDIDVDGTDDAMFGDAQFGEADVLRVELEADVDVDQHLDQRSNHDRLPQATDSSSPRPRGSDEDMDKLDVAILTARSRGDNLALIAALEAKLEAMVCLAPWCHSYCSCFTGLACACDLSHLSVTAC